jgi:guanine deaminase
MTATRNRLVFKSLVMNPISISHADFYDPGYLVVCDGRIEELTDIDPRSRLGNAEFHDLTGFAILPGFVDTHVHLPQFAIMGIGSQSLLDWLSNYTYPEEARFSDPDYAWRISEVFFDALTANGTTCACIYCSVHERATDIAFEVASRRRIRAFIGKTMMDRNVPPPLFETTESSIQASVNLCSKWDGAAGGRLRYVFTPRFAGSCSMDLMRETARIAQEREAFIQSHLSENQDEVRWIRSLFPERTSYTDVYGCAGMLGERTIIAHCVHLAGAEVSLLAATRTNIVFCPYSNRVLRSGTMPYGELQAAGLKIALGSDIAGGPSLSMFRQMGEALNSANVQSACLSPGGALYLATLAGAEVLGLAGRIGNFEAGKDADFVVVDYERVDPLLGTGQYMAPADILSRLCYNGDSNCVKAVYAGGIRISSEPFSPP